MTAKQTKTVELALGRIFRMGARPTQDGDVAEYERCRGIIMDILEGTKFDRPIYEHDYQRDRLKGAQGGA